MTSHLATPGPLGTYSDAAHRLSDAVTLALLADRADNVGRYLAARLSDGGTDGVLYDTRADAVRHQLHEHQCVYVLITPDGMTPRDAEIVLTFWRLAYDKGFRGVTPPRDLQIPQRIEHVPAHVREVIRRARTGQ